MSSPLTTFSRRNILIVSALLAVSAGLAASKAVEQFGTNWLLSSAVILPFVFAVALDQLRSYVLKQTLSKGMEDVERKLLGSLEAAAGTKLRMSLFVPTSRNTVKKFWSRTHDNKWEQTYYPMGQVSWLFKAMRRGELVITDDEKLNQHATDFPESDSKQFRSLLAVPIMAHRRIVGVLSLDSDLRLPEDRLRKMALRIQRYAAIHDVAELAFQSENVGPVIHVLDGTRSKEILPREGAKAK